MRQLLKSCGAVLALLLAFSGGARAQGSLPGISAVDLSGAYSYIRARSAGTGGSFSVNGGNAEAAFNFTSRIAAVGEFGMYRFSGLPSGLSSTMYTYLFGPRISVFKVRAFEPFVEALAGGGRLNAAFGSIQAGENGFALAAGGGVDAQIGKHFSIRIVQADYFLTRFPQTSGSSAFQNSVRISAGIVFHFGNRETAGK